MAKEKKEKEITWIDVHNEDLMIALGIRPKNLEPRDPSVWTKTTKDKKMLSRMRRIHKHSLVSGSPVPFRVIPFKSKLIIQIKPDPQYVITKNGIKYNKTTFSTVCAQSDIPFILSKYISNKGKSLVIKYYWNGKTYTPDTLPFWK